MLYGTAESGGAVHTPNRPPRMSYAKHPVRWAPNGTGAPVQDVSVDLGRARVVVTEKLLDSPDVVAVFQAEWRNVWQHTRLAMRERRAAVLTAR